MRRYLKPRGGTVRQDVLAATNAKHFAVFNNSTGQSNWTVEQFSSSTVLSSMGNTSAAEHFNSPTGPSMRSSHGHFAEWSARRKAKKQNGEMMKFGGGEGKEKKTIKRSELLSY